jgi:hypothetical protein
MWYTAPGYSMRKGLTIGKAYQVVIGSAKWETDPLNTSLNLTL